MYAMIQIDESCFDFPVPQETRDHASIDQSFARLLLEEEAVSVLPGTCFGAPGFLRVVTCAPTSVLSEAFGRIAHFCDRHSQITPPFLL